MRVALNVLGAICLLVGVYGCTETILMLAAVPAETAASYAQAEEDVWWAAAVAIGGLIVGSLGLYLAHRLTKPPRIVRGVQ
jgi:uncharacterized membrane protein YfcA